MSLLTDWISGDAWNVVKDKFNAIVSSVNNIGGGTTGQYLKKSSNTDFNVEWDYPVPAGGTTGQILSKASDTDFDLTWNDQLGVNIDISGDTDDTPNVITDGSGYQSLGSKIITQDCVAIILYKITFDTSSGTVSPIITLRLKVNGVVVDVLYYNIVLNDASMYQVGGTLSSFHTDTFTSSDTISLEVNWLDNTTSQSLNIIYQKFDIIELPQ